jgi:hypothetical protein
MANVALTCIVLICHPVHSKATQDSKEACSFSSGGLDRLFNLPAVCGCGRKKVKSQKGEQASKSFGFPRDNVLNKPIGSAKGDFAHPV